jgi:hypothetical protein
VRLTRSADPVSHKPAWRNDQKRRIMHSRYVVQFWPTSPQRYIHTLAAEKKSRREFPRRPMRLGLSERRHSQNERGWQRRECGHHLNGLFTIYRNKEKPAGWPRRLIIRRYEMSASLILLLLIVVILGIEVKIRIDRR